MNPSLAELLAALPAAEGEPEDRLDAVLLHGSSTARAGGGVPVGAAAPRTLGPSRRDLSGLRRLVGAQLVPLATNQQALVETQLRVALKLVAGMSYLRGAVMKVGQTLANLPGVVPDEIVDTLEASTSRRRRCTSALARACPQRAGRRTRGSLRRVRCPRLCGRLARPGPPRPPEVRRGGRRQGPVPGIGASIRADFRNLLGLMLPMRVSKDWDNLKAQLEDLRRVLEWETDYEKEADFQCKARSLFREDDQVVGREFTSSIQPAAC